MLKRLHVVFFMVLLIVTLLVINIPFANADLPVVDFLNYNQNYTMLADQLKATINTFTQIDNQIKQLDNEAKNLNKMGADISNLSINNIQTTLSNLVTIMQNFKGIALNYERMQENWDSMYGNFDKYNGMSAADYATQSKILRDQTSNSLYDAMKAQGLIAELSNDATNINSLLYESSSSEGALQALQVANQLSSTVIQQLMRLQTIMATSYRAESSYYAEMVEQDAASQANSPNLTFNTPNTLDNSGNPEGFKDFE